MLNFTRARPGDVINIPAAVWNRLLDSLGARLDQGAQEMPYFAPVEIQVKNNTGSALARFGIVGVGDVVTTRTAGLGEFSDNNVFLGETPSATSTIAIVQEPLSADKIGRAVIAGVTACKLNVTSSGDTHASPTTSTTELTTGTSGTAVILWKESGTGTGKWAKVLLTGSASGDDSGGGCCADQPLDEYHPTNAPFATTFESRRPFGAGAATTSNIQGTLVGDFTASRLSSDAIDWTHILIYPTGTDLRDGCTRLLGSNALGYADGDEVRIPSGASSPRFVVVFCEVVNKGLSGPDYYEYYRAFLMRHAP